jgi:hypothetical protein
VKFGRSFQTYAGPPKYTEIYFGQLPAAPQAMPRAIQHQNRIALDLLFPMRCVLALSVHPLKPSEAVSFNTLKSCPILDQITIWMSFNLHSYLLPYSVDLDLLCHKTYL